MTKSREKRGLGGVAAHESWSHAGRCAEFPGLLFLWPWHIVVRQNALTFDPAITELLKGCWWLASELVVYKEPLLMT